MKLSNLSLREKESLFRELRISITHHSNAMEGTTLSFGETKELLANGSTAGGKPLSEQLVILGFAKAYDVVVREASNSAFKISASFIKDLHFIMFEDALQVSSAFIEKPIGAYRIDERYIKGVDIKLSTPNMIGQDLENLLYQYDKSELSLEEIASFHIAFETIHPFADGNGRIGRLLMAFQYIQNDFVPALILNDNRKEYLEALADSALLKDFLTMSCEESLKLIEQLEFMENARSLLRKLQQYSVQLYPYQMEKLSQWIERPKPGINVLRSETLYSDHTGLKCEAPEGEGFFI